MEEIEVVLDFDTLVSVYDIPVYSDGFASHKLC